MGLRDFEIGEQLGAGAVGTVFAAEHRTSGVRVALKTALPAHRGAAISLERELAALARLDHPAILHLYDHGVADEDEALPPGTHWMALEFAGEGALEDWIPEAWGPVRDHLFAVLDGLAHAHARGLIHRDLKPANFVICGPRDIRPGLKIADFGLAWATRRDRGGLARAGSPAYMPPEQVRGDPHAMGPATDLYALGCVAWEWCTGAPPFGFREVTDALSAQVSEQVGAFVPRFHVPDGVEPLLRAMLEKRPADRPPSAAHVRRALHRLGRTRHSGPLRTEPLPVPTRWRTGAGAPSTAILTGVGLGLFALRDPPIVGRDAEQQALWSALRRVATEGQGEVVALTGVPGVGRRRLARWMAERAAELGCATVIRVTADRDLSVVLPAWAPAERRDALQAEATRGPVLVVAEVPTDRDLGELASGLLLDRALGPILLVLVGRPEERLHHALQRLGGFSRVALGPLPRQVLADFLETLGLARGLADLVASEARGDPGLAVAWVRARVARGDLAAGSAGFELRPGVDLEVSPALDEARRAQVDGALAKLPEEGRLALALGALLDQEVRASEWLPLMRRVGLGPRSSPLRRMARAGLVEPTDKGWTIADSTVRHALIDELDRHGTRADFHAAAAEVLARLEPTVDRSERLGRHLVAAGRPDAARAPLLKAMEGRRLEGRWIDVSAVVELLSKDVDIDALPTQERYSVRYFGTLAKANIQGPAAAVPEARALLAVASDLPHHLEHKALRLGAEVLGLASRFDEARAALARTDPNQVAMRRLAALIELDDGDFDEGIRLYKALFDDAEGSDKAKAANGLGRAYGMRADPEQAERWFRECLAYGNELQTYVPLCNIALVRMLHGDPLTAVPLIREAEASVRADNVGRRGFVALMAALIAVAAHEKALFERVKRRALFHVDRGQIDDPDAVIEALEVARARALPQHRDFLDILEQRLRP